MVFVRLNGFSKQSCGRTIPLMIFIAIDRVGHVALGLWHFGQTSRNAVVFT